MGELVRLQLIEYVHNLDANVFKTYPGAQVRFLEKRGLIQKKVHISTRYGLEQHINIAGFFLILFLFSLMSLVTIHNSKEVLNFSRKQGTFTILLYRTGFWIPKNLYSCALKTGCQANNCFIVVNQTPAIKIYSTSVIHPRTKEAFKTRGAHAFRDTLKEPKADAL